VAIVLQISRGMEIDPHSALALAALAVLLLLFGIGCAVAAIRQLNVPTYFRCPFMRCDVAVLFEEWGGRRHDVLRCSVFRTAEGIDCGKRCLDADTASPRASFGGRPLPPSTT
jgi:hypothetical protein